MRYEDKLKYILKCINENSYYITSHTEIVGYCEGKFESNDMSSSIIDLLNDLVKQDFVYSDTANIDGKYLSGYCIKEKGKSFLADEIHPFQHLKKNDELPKGLKEKIWYYIKKYGWKILIFICGIVVTIIIQKIADRYPYFPNF